MCCLCLCDSNNAKTNILVEHKNQSGGISLTKQHKRLSGVFNPGLFLICSDYKLQNINQTPKTRAFKNIKHDQGGTNLFQWPSNQTPQLHR